MAGNRVAPSSATRRSRGAVNFFPRRLLFRFKKSTGTRETRITGGIARGISLSLPTRGEIRPATDYLREAVFSSLGDAVSGTLVLDCFAGTGAYACEALSRGAAGAILIDKNPAAILAQKKNLAAVEKSIVSRGGAVPAVRIFFADLLSEPALPPEIRGNASADLIFCDPPWALWTTPLAPVFVEKISACAKKDSAGPRLILETPAGTLPPTPAGWELLRRIGKKGKEQPCANIFAWAGTRVP